jgi:hypothetical protein
MTKRFSYLYLIKLNHTCFDINPGRIELPKGRYIAEIRDGTFGYKLGFAADIQVTYMSNGKKKHTKLPELGRFDNAESSRDAYQGLAIEFNHDGGAVEVYNPRLASTFHGQCTGTCDVAIWDANNFGAPVSEEGFKDIEDFNADSNGVLIVTSNPKTKPYADKIGANLHWQSDLRNLSKYRVVVFPQESYQFLPMVRDNNCIDQYVKSGGRIYLIGAAPQYLTYEQAILKDLPSYLGDGKYSTVGILGGDHIVKDDGSYLLSFGTPVTVPMISTKTGQIARLRNTSGIHDWCAATRNAPDKGGKIAWSSYFLMDYANSENWNRMVLAQIDWLTQ